MAHENQFVSRLVSALPSNGLSFLRILAVLFSCSLIICNITSCNPRLKRDASTTGINSRASSSEVLSLPTGFFLLPPPFSGGKNQYEIIDLMSSPTPDRSLLMEKAHRFESISRAALQSRAHTLRQMICRMSEGNRKKNLQLWPGRSAHENRLWTRMNGLYLDNIRRLIRLQVGAQIPNLYDSQALIRSAELTARLRFERQREIQSYFQRYFAYLGQGGCPPIREEPPLPTTSLYAPIYLSLYRFYISLEPGFRTRLILNMHSGRSTDK